MPIELLKRGQSVTLTKDHPKLEELFIGLGWDTQKYSGQHDFDLDVALFALNENGKCNSDKDLVFYHSEHLVHPSGAIKHSGDERKGDKEGFDESIIINLKGLPSYVKKMVGTITIYDAQVRQQNFGQVSNAFVKLLDNKTKEELYSYDLGETFSIQTAVKVFEVYEYQGEWKFKALGDGYEDGLAKFVEEFGLYVEGERK